jgi:hypothetical protein
MACTHFQVPPAGRFPERRRHPQTPPFRVHLHETHEQAGDKNIRVPRLVNRLLSSYEVEGTHPLDNVDVGGITLVDKYREQGSPFLLGMWVLENDFK